MGSLAFDVRVFDKVLRLMSLTLYLRVVDSIC